MHLGSPPQDRRIFFGKENIMAIENGPQFIDPVQLAKAGEFLHQLVIIEDTTAPNEREYGEVVGVQIKRGRIVAVVKKGDHNVVHVHTTPDRQLDPRYPVFRDRSSKRVYAFLSPAQAANKTTIEKFLNPEEEVMTAG